MQKSSDFFAALNGQQPVHGVPLWELEFHLWDAMSGQHVLLGNEFNKLAAAEREKALYRNADIFLRVAHECNFSAITVPGSYWEIAPGVPAYYWLPEDARYKQADILNRIGTSDLVLVANTGGVMAMPDASNYVDFAYLLYDNPGQVDALAEQCLVQGLERVQRFFDLGIRVMLTASDLADNHGPYFNPQQMQRFVYPYMARWAAEIAGQGGLSVLHTDGNISSYVEDLADTGINALQAIDPVAGMDIVELKNRIGNRLCLCGNIDVGLLQDSSPARIRESVRSLVTSCKSGGGFILGASNAVQYSGPVLNYRALLQAWEKYRRY